jgi:hypothetical protein
MKHRREITGLLPRPLAAAAAAILLSLLACQLPAAEPENKPTRALTEKIESQSPNGKYALRIMYDEAMNEELSAAPDDKDHVDPNAIHSLAIVSLPGKEIMHDFQDVFRSGEGGTKLLWSSDSKWCAIYDSGPRLGYTTVLHLAGDKFVLAHKPDDLNVPADGNVRNEYIEAIRWVKPGVLELSVNRIYRGDEPSKAITGFTASFDGKGGWKVLKKKR